MKPEVVVTPSQMGGPFGRRSPHVRGPYSMPNHTNKLVAEAKSEDSLLFKLSNRVRGSGMVGEMGTLIAEAFCA